MDRPSAARDYIPKGTPIRTLVDQPPALQPSMLTGSNDERQQAIDASVYPLSLSAT